MMKCHAHLLRRMTNQLTPGDTETAVEMRCLIDSTQHLLNCRRCILTLVDCRIVV